MRSARLLLPALCLLLPAPLLADDDKAKTVEQLAASARKSVVMILAGGVVSARRDVEGRPMIELRMPVEPGNSGGPLLDLRGRVQGVVTLKSAVTENLGYATPVNALKPLLDKPNPIPMARWLTIGALDADEWTTLGSARWRQRAGRIQVEGMGA